MVRLVLPFIISKKQLDLAAKFLFKFLMNIITKGQVTITIVVENLKALSL